MSQGDPATPRAVAAQSGASRVQATPVVRRIAEELGVDLAAVTGTGPGGRITEDDVRGAPLSGRTRAGASRSVACGG